MLSQQEKTSEAKPSLVAQFKVAIGKKNTSLDDLKRLATACILEQDEKKRGPLFISIFYPARNELSKYLIQQPAVDLDQKDKFGQTMLMYVAHDGEVDLAEMLLKFGANPSLGNELKAQPIHVAIIEGQLGVVRLLVKYGADIEARNKQEETPLSVASFYGKFEIAKFLVESGADLNAKQYTNKAPIHVAAHLDIFKLLLEKGADICAPPEEKLKTSDLIKRIRCPKAASYFSDYLKNLRSIINTIDKLNSNKAIKELLTREPTYRIKHLLEFGHFEKLLLGEKYLFCKNILDRRIEWEKKEAAAAKLKKEYPIKAKKGISLFQTQKKQSPASLLIKLDEQPPVALSSISVSQAVDRKESLQSELLSGSQQVEFKVVAKVETETKGDAKQSISFEPLMKPKLIGSTPKKYFYQLKKLIKKLLQAKELSTQQVLKQFEVEEGPVEYTVLTMYEVATIAQQSKLIDSQGNTILHLAAQAGRVDVIFSVISDQLVAVNAINHLGYTALEVALYYNQKTAARYLAANSKYEGINLVHALHLAAEKGYLLVLKKLLDQGGDVDAILHHDFSTPLHTGLLGGQEEVVKYLIKRGATVNWASSPYGYRPLHIAASLSSLSMVEFLLENGAELDAVNNEGFNALRFVDPNKNEMKYAFLKRNMEECKKIKFLLKQSFISQRSQEEVARFLQGLPVCQLRYADKQLAKKNKKSNRWLSQYRAGFFNGRPGHQTQLNYLRLPKGIL